MYIEITKREQMDKIMAESRKRKTRRGKKKSKKSGTDYESGQWKRFHNVSHRWCHLRPTLSPPAPFNSNMFLIEDREEQLICSPPLQTLEEKSGELDLISDTISLHTQDSYYEPLWMTDSGDDFMVKEFEKDYSAAFEQKSLFQSQLNSLGDLSKEQIVQKCLDLEQNYSRKMDHSDFDEVKKKSFQSVIAELKMENARLQQENEQLKSILSLR